MMIWLMPCFGVMIWWRTDLWSPLCGTGPGNADIEKTLNAGLADEATA
jgi:hypothetical protein